MYSRRVQHPVLKLQEIPFDDPESDRMFQPGPEKPFVATPAAIEMYRDSIRHCLEILHRADEQKRSNELDPMLASTGGVTWHIGVSCTRVCDFKRGCDGVLPESKAITVPVDRVIADRRRKFDQDGNPRHLEYEKAFGRELRRKGLQNQEIRRNFYLEDTVEEGNFTSRERLLSCARGPHIIVPCDTLFLGLDWGRVSDQTIATVGNDRNDVLDWFRYPKMRYEDQIALLISDLKHVRKRRREDGTEEEFDYFS